MPREGYKPMTVKEETRDAVEALRDSRESYSSYDAALTDLLLEADDERGFMDEETRVVLEERDDD